MTTLSSDDKDQLLIRPLSQGRGSLEFARNMLNGSDDIDPPSPQPEQNIPETWCTCGVCRRMPDEQENVCCKKRTRVTSYVMFNTVCLDREAAISYKSQVRHPRGRTRLLYSKLQEDRLLAIHIVEIW